MGMRKHAISFARNLGLGSVLEYYKKNYASPIFTNQTIKSIHSKKTLLISVEPCFNQNILSAAYLTPLSFGVGWARRFGPVKFVSIKKLNEEVRKHNDPAIFTAQNQFRHLSSVQAKELSNYKLFTWVHVHPRMMKKFINENPLIPLEECELYTASYSNLMLAEPKFVWNAVGNDAIRWFSGWVDDGLNWRKIFPGANTDFYYPEASAQYENIEMAYVGGYWLEKSLGFDMYLKPWDKIINVFGFNEWPYTHYKGGISEDEERKLYTSAGLIPLVHGPMGWNISEITERYIKAPACRAFCIADQNSAVREIFDEHEMLQANSSEEFHHLVNEYLNGRIDTDKWRDAGYAAVMSKHLVEHRAQQIYDSLALLSGSLNV